MWLYCIIIFIIFKIARNAARHATKTKIILSLKTEQLQFDKIPNANVLYIHSVVIARGSQADREAIHGTALQRLKSVETSHRNQSRHGSTMIDDWWVWRMMMIHRFASGE